MSPSDRWVSLRLNPSYGFRSQQVPQMSNKSISAIAVAGVLLLLAGTMAASSGHSSVHFNFHDYDGINDKDAKISSAHKDLLTAFPIGSPIQSLLDYFSNHDGSCQKREYIPPVDRMVLQGDHIFCQLSYPMPGHIFFGYRWSVDIKYDKQSNRIEKLITSWEPYGIGG